MRPFVRRIRLPLAAAFMAAAVTACDTPTEPEQAATVFTEDAVVEAASAALAAPGAETRNRPRHTLHELLRRAVRTLARSQGAEAAHAATAHVRELGEAVKAARESGDEAALRAAIDAMEAEAARVVVSVLGSQPLERLMEGTSKGLQRLAERVARAEEAGRDVGPLREVVDGLTAALAEAGTAVEAGEPARALVLVARAHDVLRRVADRLNGDKADVPVLHRLVRHAIAEVARTQGEPAAEALKARVQALQQDVKAAREAGDEEAFRAAVEALAIGSATIVVDVLGTEPVDRVLGAGAAGLERMARRIEHAAGQGRDVTEARRVLEELTALHGQAVQAAESGDPVTALVLGARVVDVLDRKRKG